MSVKVEVTGEMVMNVSLEAVSFDDLAKAFSDRLRSMGATAYIVSLAEDEAAIAQAKAKPRLRKKRHAGTGARKKA